MQSRVRLFSPQIFVFGGFALRANLFGLLEQIESYAPGHQISFGNLNYVADIRGDLIFDGLEPTAAAPCHRDEHDLNLSSDHTQEIAPISAPTLDLSDVNINRRDSPDRTDSLPYTHRLDF